MIYFIVGLISFIAGFCLASISKDNITIRFGNQNVTMIDGEVIDKKKKK
jgi:hypothetical protein